MTREGRKRKAADKARLAKEKMAINASHPMNDDSRTIDNHNDRKQQVTETEKQVSVVGLTTEGLLQCLIEELRRWNGKNDSDDNSESKRQKILERSAVWQARAAVAIAILTVASIVIGALQWSVMSQQNSIAERNGTFQLRAWVGIDTAEFNKPDDSATAVLELRIKNFGTTPAYNMLANVHFDYLPPPFTPIETAGSSVGAHPPSMIVIGPQSTHVHTEKVTITDERMKRLTTKKSQLQVSGYIIYDDVFKKHHRERFRLQWGGRYGTEKIFFDTQGNDGD